MEFLEYICRKLMSSVNSLQHEFRVMNIYKFISYITENALHLHCKDQAMLDGQIIVVCSKNSRCVCKIRRVFNVKAYIIFIYHFYTQLLQSLMQLFIRQYKIKIFKILKICKKF
jgi:hypothetical protein